MGSTSVVASTSVSSRNSRRRQPSSARAPSSTHGCLTSSRPSVSAVSPLTSPSGSSSHPSTTSPSLMPQDIVISSRIKSLYDLKQAPRIWYEHFLRSLLSFGFIRSEIDPCLFIYKKDGITMYGLLWVDDLIILDDDKTRRDEFVAYLRTTRGYTIADKGEATWVLGIAITRDRAERTIALSQQLYIETVCNRFSSYLSASTARNFDVPAMADLSNFSQ